MRTKIFWSFFILFVFLLFTKNIQAAIDIVFTNTPTNVDINQEFEIDVLLNCSSCGDSYLRAVFFKSGSNYFGFTQNGNGEWVGTSDDKTKYLLVRKGDLVEGTWSGKLRVKPEPESSYYIGPGDYFFKVARYTPSGGATWANEVGLEITGSTTKPSDSLTQDPISNPTTNPTIAPTSIPKPTVKATSAPKPTSTTIAQKDQENNESLVLGLREELNQSPSPTPESGEKKNFPFFALGFVFLGAGFLGFAGYSFFKQKEKGYTNESENGTKDSSFS